jgi:hypothetical protein
MEFVQPSYQSLQRPNAGENDISVSTVEPQEYGHLHTDVAASLPLPFYSALERRAGTTDEYGFDPKDRYEQPSAMFSIAQQEEYGHLALSNVQPLPESSYSALVRRVNEVPEVSIYASMSSA